MKRILHIVGSMDRAGAETMIMNLYQVLNKEKLQFDFLYFTAKECDYDEEIVELGGKIYRILESNLLRRMIALKKLLIENNQWQTVHCHTLFNNAFNLYIAYKAGVPQRISHSHSTSDNSKNIFISKIYHFFSRKIQRKYATDFIACGVDAGKFLFPQNKKISIIHNSIEVAKFINIKKSNSDYLKNEYKLSSDCVILIQIGRLEKVKNYAFSLQIAKQLKEKNINFRLFIAGQGHLETELKDIRKNYDLNKEVHFLGVRSDIPYLLAGADLMLMPSLFEGFPVSLVESQAANTPALISDSISKEVDLGMNLIHFESLKNPISKWADKIKNIREYVGCEDEVREDILKQSGFDAQENIKSLENIYLNYE